jgi:hypothetical protein
MHSDFYSWLGKALLALLLFLTVPKLANPQAPTYKVTLLSRCLQAQLEPRSDQLTTRVSSQRTLPLRTGKTGLYNYSARSNWPAIARFVSPRHRSGRTGEATII